MQTIYYYLERDKQKNDYSIYTLNEEKLFNTITGNDNVVNFLDNANWSVNEGQVKLVRLLFNEFADKIQETTKENYNDLISKTIFESANH